MAFHDLYATKTPSRVVGIKTIGNHSMQSEIGSVVLGSLTAIFAGYGIWELTIAYKTVALKAWGERAIVGVASMFVAAVFGVMTLQTVS